MVWFSPLLECCFVCRSACWVFFLFLCSRQEHLHYARQLWNTYKRRPHQFKFKFNEGKASEAFRDKHMRLCVARWPSFRLRFGHLRPPAHAAPVHRKWGAEEDQSKTMEPKQKSNITFFLYFFHFSLSLFGTKEAMDHCNCFCQYARWKPTSGRNTLPSINPSERVQRDRQYKQGSLRLHSCRSVIFL